ncbi:MAG: ParA family protein [Kiritimatiellia bacterium]|jgi:chromosome partitioning protein|nr:ParA family protein [Kiritimatiellia bacterium]MDP6847653.1 ParA family protein [Kiritimatiellia bacterium]
MGTKTVGIANQKGGVGKTTTVISLATCMAELGRDILVVDLDPQSNATSGLGLPRQEGRSLYRALLNPMPIDSLIQKTAIEGVDLVPAELDLAGCEVEIARADEYLHCLAKVLRPLAESSRYDFILLDCPPSLGILTMNALTASDSLLVPMQCEYYALEGLSVITNLLDRIKQSGANPRLRLEGVLMTMFDTRTNLAEQVVKEVREHFGDAVYETLIPRNVRLSEAPSFGQPITLYDSHSSGARAYRFFSREFIKRARAHAADERPTEPVVPQDAPVAAETAGTTVEAAETAEAVAEPTA